METGITLQERDYEFIKATGKWSRFLFVILSLLLLFGSIAFFMANQPTGYLPSSAEQGSGYAIKKSYFLNVSTWGYVFLLCECLYLSMLLYLLFRFSSAAKAVGEHKRAADFTEAMLQLSRLFKLTVYGAVILLGLMVLAML